MNIINNIITIPDDATGKDPSISALSVSGSNSSKF